MKMRLISFLQRARQQKRSPGAFPFAWVVLGFALLIFAAACNTQVVDSDTQATVQALATAVPLTATARAGTMPNPYDQLQTAVAEATQVAAQAQATIAAQQTLQAFQGNATQQAFAPVMAELPYFGVDPNTEGYPGWIHAPLTLTAKGYHTYTYGTNYPQTVIRDGVLSAKITWDTRYGSGGCGFVLRANGDEQAPSEYVVLLTRGGWLIFTVIANGEIANIRPMAVKDHDNAFAWRNGTTNQLTVVLRDNKVAIYTNHALHKVLDPNEMPSLYVPVLLPPVSHTSDGQPVPAFQAESPPAPPDDPTDPDQLAAYLRATNQYAARMLQRLAAYKKDLQALSAQETNPTRRAALDDYLASVSLHEQLFQKSVGAIQFYVGHRGTDLNFGAGFLSFMAAAESSYATCTFNEGWLWVLDPR